jgi:hypothetical protein
MHPGNVLDPDLAVSQATAFPDARLLRGTAERLMFRPVILPRVTNYLMYIVMSPTTGLRSRVPHRDIDDKKRTSKEEIW